ncbi:ATP synthase subunit b, mitochondrial-like [Rhynchophorus ferrugineus]|uniref:ATP synthase subunit b, mitochondrial-like n=1 Tax=Rhynchophorus ferrugineus TaxID=354439 RepID=UPI003FCE4782
MLSKPRYVLAKSPVAYYKFYCDNKTKSTEELVLNKPKKSKTDSINASEIIPKSYDQCISYEEKVLKDILIEKEKEANLQSRLAKECRTLFNAPLNKTNFKKYGSINLNKISFSEDVVCKSWETYDFDRVENKKDKCGCATTKKIEKKVDDGGHYKAEQGGGNDGVGTGLINRPVRHEPGRVLGGFIPVEWWQVFFQKTGVTGFGTFLFTFATFLVSKEIYVLEHYYYHGLSAFFLWLAAIKYTGPMLANRLDKQIEELEKSWNEDRVETKKNLEESIVHDLFLQFQSQGQLILIDAKRENVHLQLEEEFRKRQMHVYREVLKRLEYQEALVQVHQKIQHKNLVQYVTREVTNAITPEMQDRLINYSIDKILEDINKIK